MKKVVNHFHCDICRQGAIAIEPSVPTGWIVFQIDDLDTRCDTEERHVCGRCVERIVQFANPRKP